MMHPILLQTIYVGWVVWFAFLNKKWIDDGWRIRHAVNGVAHLIAAFVAYLNFGWPIAIAILFIVATFFDGFLSMFRGLSFDYVSPKPMSIKDRIEKRIFGMNGILPKLIYLIVATLLNFYYACFG